MRIPVVFLGLILMGAAPVIVPNEEPRQQCAAVIFSDSGDVAIASGRSSCREASQEVLASCLSGTKGDTECKDEPYEVNNQWIAIFQCKDFKKERAMLFIFSHPQRDAVPEGTRILAEKHEFKISDCVEVKTFHSSEWY